MTWNCKSDTCEIRQVCGELQKLGCSGDGTWLALVLFVRNLVRLLTIYDDLPKKTFQNSVVASLSQRNVSSRQLQHLIEQLETFLAHNRLTDELQRQLERQNDSANDLARSVEDFLQEARDSERNRGRLLTHFGQEANAALERCDDVADMVRTVRLLVTDMLRHYRDQALAWEQRARELERLVNVDPLLTPLRNRRALDAYLQRAVSEAEAHGTPLSVLMIDVDNFKTGINDVYGHQVGDDVLRSLAKIIGDYAQDHDWLAARYGGDELVLVGPMDADQAQFYAEAIRLAVQAYEFKPRISGRLQGEPIHFTVSIGVAEFQPGLSWSALLEAADDAMYQVKETGKNNVIRYHGSPPDSGGTA